MKDSKALDGVDRDEGVVEDETVVQRLKGKSRAEKVQKDGQQRRLLEWRWWVGGGARRSLLLVLGKWKF